MKSRLLVPIFLIASIACSPSNGDETAAATADTLPATPQSIPSEARSDEGQEPARATASGTVYVPVYSHIYYRSAGSVINLAATLSVRNTDSEFPIVIASVRYYGSDGELLRRYLERPLRLPPMASTDFVVEEDDTSGGSGANFLVEWTADQNVNTPVIEAVMISTQSTLGISFTSAGRVLDRP